MFWLIIVIIAHLFNAVVFIVDKYLLKRPIPNPLVYAFYVSVLSLGVLILAPFGFSFENLNTRIVIHSFIAGTTFLVFLIYFYKAIKLRDVSSIVPLIGGTAAIFTLILARFILNEILTPRIYFAFFLLVVGGVLITLPTFRNPLEIPGISKGLPYDKKGNRFKTALSLSAKPIIFALLAAAFFALSSVVSKIVFNQTDFISGFITIRFGNFLAALALLVPTGLRKAIFSAPSKTGFKISTVFVFNKVLAGFAFILLNFAILLSTPTLVNAMQGLQYVFLFILAIILHLRFSKIYEEELTFGRIFQKSISIILIATGIVLLIL